MNNVATKPSYIYLYRLLSITILVLLVTACAESKIKISQNSNRNNAETISYTFSIGLRKISERYIKPYPVSDLALKGLKGLTTLDPTFRVETNNNIISIRSDTSPLYQYSRPDKNDPKGWADLIGKTIFEFQRDSPLFRRIKMKRLYQAIFDSVISLLDPFSRYSSAEKAQQNRDQRSGFGGIGILFKYVDKGIALTQLYAGAPAFKMGLKLNDIITHVDGNSLAGLNQNIEALYLRGKIGSIVDIKVLRRINSPPANTTFISTNYSLVRDRIAKPTVSHSVRNGIVYLRLSGFNSQTTIQVASNLVRGIKKSGQQAKGIIIDLRGNPGGLLKQAVQVSDLFLVNGRIISTRGRHPGSYQNYEASGTDLTNGLPLVVLINGRSASASEIVAASLQDQERAIIIGSTSFGKGTVQTVIRLPNNGEITLTWSRFQAPSGYFLHGLGVPPSVCASGGHNLTADEYIKRALNQANQYSKTLHAWRAVHINQTSKRQRLKEICPTANKQTSVDIEIAETLLLDKLLFQQVKLLNSSPANLTN
jgi:carboxyl-terminal processing protease